MTTAPKTPDCNETVNAVGIRCSALLARIETMTNQDIKLLCGEMSR
jgi:hypothetical protein